MEKTENYCPCCSFDLDLFLPDSEKQTTATTGDDDDNENDSSSSLPDITETVNQLTSLSDNDDNDGENQGCLPVIIVDTHGHAQLDRKRDETYALKESKENDDDNKNDIDKQNQIFRVKSLACSVEPADFENTLKYAATSDSILPALGVHPWYIENLPGYSTSSNSNSNDSDDVGNSDNDDNVDNSDSEWLLPMEALLLKHPNCLVGEIGLCKIAKWVRTHPDGKATAMAIQKRIFQKQMILAAKLRRPVSVHCVNSHGIFVSAIKELVEKRRSNEEEEEEKEEDTITTTSNKSSSSSSSRRFLLPPVIGMHSFTGTAHHVKELLELEHEIDFPNDNSRTTRKKKKAPKNNKNTEKDNAESPLSPPPPPPLFYFGFSHTVNYAMCTSEKSRKKGKEAVQAVPINRLLVESDVHSDADVAGGTIGAIAYVAWARSMKAKEVVSATTKNGSMFLGSIGI